jgi:hypothetical protein
MLCKSLHRAAPGCTEHGPTALYGPSIPRPWPAPPPGLGCFDRSPTAPIPAKASPMFPLGNARRATSLDILSFPKNAGRKWTHPGHPRIRGSAPYQGSANCKVYARGSA